MAKDFVGTLTFAISSWDELGHEVTEYGFEKGENPVVGLRDDKGKKYKMTESYSVDNLRQFAQSFLDGELEPHVKSEPVPDPNEGPVTVRKYLNIAQPAVKLYLTGFVLLNPVLTHPHF